uniref:BTB domain-containing protein n=1 Tax=Coccidioides posadasii RMSCC 3488 TaxID=454284 RepID=A0A0J6FI41_COCPO|nr:hypothetical protein CPAG_05373 [Coccidioides posadasii RMSCC 3488]
MPTHSRVWRFARFFSMEAWESHAQIAQEYQGVGSSSVSQARAVKGELVFSKFPITVAGDLTIICGSECLPAHRIVVCPQSAYFTGGCDGGLEKVLEYLYTGNYTLELPEPTSHAEDPSCSEYEPMAAIEDPAADNIAGSSGLVVGHGGDTVADVEPPSGQNMPDHPAHFHVMMYAQADYFQIDGLKTVAKKYFQMFFFKSPSPSAIRHHYYRRLPFNARAGSRT